jgi:hypothetical protein
MRPRRLFRSRHIRRLATWFAALVVASLFIPAMTAQWADRQKELELKTALIAEMTESAAGSLQDAVDFVDLQQKAWPHPKEEDWYKRYRAILKDWKVAAFSLESRLSAYFPHASVRLSKRPSLARSFHVYNERVQQFIYLTLNLCKEGSLRTDEEQMGPARRLEKYLSISLEADSDYSAIVTDTPPRSQSPCWRKTREFFKDYDHLASKLLDQRTYFVDAIVHSSAAGYNVGFRDFVRQVLPFY